MHNEQLPPIEVSENDLRSHMVSHMVYEEQIRQAKGHTGKNDRFVQLPWDPRDVYEDPKSGYPGQLLEDFQIEPDMTPHMEPFIEASGEIFLEGFSKITETFYEDKQLLSDITEKIDDGENVVVVTNHGEIYDIAVILAAMRVALAKHSIDNEREPLTADRFNLIVHRMISQLGVPDQNNPDGPPAPALSILQLVGETFLSFPRTENAKKAYIPPVLDRTCTELMLHNLSLKMSEGGQILAFAPSGSKDESILDRFGKRRKVIKPVNSGTYRLMRQDKTWILAVGVALDQEDGPACSISELTQCETDEECHQLLESIAERHTRLTGIKTFYARKQADLDAWREETAETVHEVKENPEKRNKILVPAGTLAVGAVAGFLFGRHLRNKKSK